MVVPSLGEGFGMVALEAMERARPVIAAAIGGLEDLVRDGETGLLVQPGDADPLADAMLELAADPARAAASGRRRAAGRSARSECAAPNAPRRSTGTGSASTASCSRGVRRRRSVHVVPLPQLEHAEAPQPVAVVGLPLGRAR